MIFGRKPEEEAPPPQTAATQTGIAVVHPDDSPFEFAAALRETTGKEVILVPQSGVGGFGGAEAIIAIAQPAPVLNQLLAKRPAGAPLVVCVPLHGLKDLGDWLKEKSVEETLSGIRLILCESSSQVIEKLGDKLEPTTDPNCIKMPISPEVQNSGYKYFFMMSTELRAVVRTMRELAENNVQRIYLLGGPGIGKTSLAYYFFLRRGKGNFVTVNMNSESTDDKAAMKSLLCGHVSGAIPGGGAREGAISFARDGVCFLDESHGVSGIVMQVLMEALDSGQYLPFGATAKRLVECSVIFASNRSWETLRSMIHLDEHARLGAMIVKIPDLRKREEDLVAVLAVLLSNFAKQCTTWKAPAGISRGAWAQIKACPWRGNTRTLMRVIETASVTYGMGRPDSSVIEDEHIKEGISLWEPEEHPDANLYTSY